MESVPTICRKSVIIFVKRILLCSLLIFTCMIIKLYMVHFRWSWYSRNSIFNSYEQSKEIGSSSTPSNVVKGTDQSSEKKKGIIDWRNLIKPMNEEKDHWVRLIYLSNFYNFFPQNNCKGKTVICMIVVTYCFISCIGPRWSSIEVHSLCSRF